MRESAVGDVFHAESDLTTHGDALGDAQRRQSTAVSRQLIAAVAARRPQERLEIALQRRTQHSPVYHRRLSHHYDELRTQLLV